jgi:hypothetical protein
MEIKPSNFPQPLEDQIGRIILENTHPILYGSAANNRLIHKGDIDLLTVIEMKNKNKAFQQIKDILRKILKDHKQNIVIGEIKFGEKTDIKKIIDDLTKTKQSIKKNKNKILEVIDENINDDGIIKELKNNIDDLTKNKQPTKNYYKIIDLLREAYTLRWNAKDILKGKADQYLDQQNPIKAPLAPIFKVDFECYTGDNYIEMSNYIILGESASDEDFAESLINNIYKTFYSNENYYKVLKRLYSYFRSVEGKDSVVENLEHLINSPLLGGLYKIISQLKAIETVYQYANKRKVQPKLKRSLNYLKWWTQYLPLELQNDTNKKLDQLCKNFNIDEVENMRRHLMDQLNKFTLKVISKNDIIKLIKDVRF